MKLTDSDKDHINQLIVERGATKFHITGIRYADHKDRADEYIVEAAKKRAEAILMSDRANMYDTDAVMCYSEGKKVGCSSVYDLEKYSILANRDQADHLGGFFIKGDTKDHYLELCVSGVVTLDDIEVFRKEVDQKKEAQYGAWQHDAIERYIVHSRHQDDARACIAQMKDFTVRLLWGFDSTTLEEMAKLLTFYKQWNQFDISLEGQRDRWDIMLYLDYLYAAHHQPHTRMDDYFEKILADASSQIGGEMGRSVSYRSYIQRLTELVTTHLPASQHAMHYLKMLPKEAFDEIRKQVSSFPQHLYHMFKTDPEEFVRTIYYARIPRKILDAFLSGIALVEAYDKQQAATNGNSTTQQAIANDKGEAPLPTDDEHKPTYIHEQHNKNCQQFFDPVYIVMQPATNNEPKAKKSNKSKPTKPKVDKKTLQKPQTLKYYKHGDKGYLKRQSIRVAIVLKKWIEWGWIDEETRADDLNALFEGVPRHCNINWTANTTILTILLQELLKQPYIEKQTRQSAKSLVEKQFGGTPNSDRTRLDEDAETKIQLTLLILDTKNPLPERDSDADQKEYDIRDAALMELYSGILHSSKSV